MQFEQVTKEERQPLPRPSIDTGLGLERMACILQGVDSVFETDLFRHLIDASASALGHAPEEKTVASFRVIADHLRSSAFLIADGVLPSNEGRGYVLRRIMRRAMRHAQLLGARDPLMHRLVWALVREMGQAYPDLVRAENLIEETLRLEEARFRKTLERGLSILDEKSAALKKGDMFDGDTAFTLYDTYGFPLDLTQDALKSRGISVDQASFTDAMDRQRAKARESWKGSGDIASENIWFPLREKLGATEFLGYDTEIAEGVVTALVKDGKDADSIATGESGAIVLNQTPFYAESGGQVGDTGLMTGEGGVKFRVTDTQKKVGDLFVHVGTVEQGTLKVGTALQLEVDHARRSSIRAHHSATHLLHEALRQVLGDHIAQRGSLVAPDRLRFDFVHQKPITPEELARVEDIANEVVLENDEVTTRLMAVDEAREAGARALFGEKYGDEVRVVSMGKQSREHGQNALGWSVELCGGTHVRRTGDIGLISVTGESAVSSGVRRIEALTGRHARKHANDTMAIAKTAASELRTTVDDMPARIAALMEERKKLERDLTDARKKLAMGGGGGGNGAAAASGVREVGNVKLMARAVEGVETKDLKSLVDDGKKQIGSGVVAIVGVTEDGKAGVVVGVTADLTSRFSAVELVKIASAALGGKGGGGRPDMAQAGGPDGAKADAALAAIEQAMAGA
jgi:alanyl-tRNA synthetase